MSERYDAEREADAFEERAGLRLTGPEREAFTAALAAALAAGAAEMAEAAIKAIEHVSLRSRLHPSAPAIMTWLDAASDAIRALLAAGKAQR